MPELPEVETIRRGVEKHFSGRTIRSVAVTGARTVRRHALSSELVGRLEGRTLAGTGRRGKYLMLRLDSGDVVVAHMGMSGRLLRCDAGDPLAEHTHAVVAFEGGPELRFVDPRTFGELFVSSSAGSDGVVPELAHLGFDPLVDPVAPRSFAAMLASRSTRIKPLLMDQRFVAGVGNLYADEILFTARLRPDRRASGLSTTEARRLYRSMLTTLRDAVEHRGSSLADEQYRDLFGDIGDYQRFHRVYGREGAPCARCRSEIVRVKSGGRSSYFCPRCQT